MTKVEKIISAFSAEMKRGRDHYARGELEDAARLFERAHILGQRFVWRHAETHFWMLKIAFKKQDLSDIFGQLIRIPLGIIGSAFGVYPVGNTGSSSISAFASLPLPEDLADLLE